MNKKSETTSQKPETGKKENVLEALLYNSDPKIFVKQFKALEPEWNEPLDFVRQVASRIPLKLYEKFYDDLIPHSFFGLSCAASTLDLFPEQYQWWPCVQQGWFISKSHKRSTLDSLPVEVPLIGTKEEAWKQFRSALLNRDFEHCFTLTRGFLKEPTNRDFFRQQILTHALRDTVYGGIKFIQLSKAWEMAEILDWENTDEILFPSLHLLALGPCSDRLDKCINQPHIEKTYFNTSDEEKGPISPKDLQNLEALVLFSDNSTAVLDSIVHLAEKGYGFNAINEALLLVAIQALDNTQMGRWIPALRAFLYTYLCRSWSQKVSAREKLQSLELASLLIQDSSQKSRENDNNRVIVDLAERVCPMDPINTLRSLISHSDPYASANTVYAILGMGGEAFKELTIALATLAVKNDARIGQGYDLLLVKACSDLYQRSNSKMRDKFLISCGFFLGRILKNYELFGAYGVK